MSLPSAATTARLPLMLALLLALAACGGGNRNPLPTIKSFDATSRTVLREESTELSWEASDASEVSLEPGLGVHPPIGRLTVKPDADTHYRLVARGEKGERSADLTVKVIQYDWSRLAAALDRLVGGDKGLRGYSFALSIKDRSVFSRAGGNLQPESPLPVSSATKTSSAAAILTLVQQGKLDLDAPVGQYLGELWPTEAPKSTITMRMLLNHTSGLPFTAACLDDRRGMTLGDCAREIAALPLQARPGASFLYSNAGYQVAGYVAEKVSGLSWSRFFDEQLAGRLGLLDYRYQGDSNPRIGMGAVSDAADYLKLQQLFLNGGKSGPAQVLSPELAESVRHNQVDGKPVLSSPLPAGSAAGGYSFGWWIADATSHAGSKGPELSNPGLLGSMPWIDYDKGYAAVLLIEADLQTGLAIQKELRPLILEQIAAVGTP